VSIAQWIMAAPPTPTPDFDLTTVTPGWTGFVAIFLIAAATVLLAMDMVRRVRRVRYRAEVLEKLAAERSAAEGTNDNETKP
jgi:hypothetical protein